MPSLGNHLVFYDGTCGLCDHAVQYILKVDRKQVFVFAPLDGETAKKILHKPPDVDSMILVENFGSPEQRIYLQSRAVWRICWLLGGSWRLLGWLCFLPGFLFDWAYRIVARQRRRFFSSACPLPNPSQRNRFLP